MGLFGNRGGGPTKPGKYETAWPKSSGLGVEPYAAEADRREAYLVYTSERRATENVPPEDMKVMEEANTLLYKMAAGTPVNEVPLIQGPIDIRWMASASSEAYAANALVTDRRFLVWWERQGKRQPGLMVLEHLGMLPRPDVRASLPYRWVSVLATDWPVRIPADTRVYSNATFTVGVHLSSDAHANRRSMSVQATLQEVERRRALGLNI